MRKLSMRGALCVGALMFGIVSTANAAIVNPILGLNIGGTAYNVTFHSGIGNSFNVLWDGDDDGVLGEGDSVFNVAPTFWGNLAGAQAASAAIVAHLGINDSTNALGDGFFVPISSAIEVDAFSPFLGQRVITIVGDFAPALNADGTTDGIHLGSNASSDTGFPYASFAVAVPIPPAVFLFGSGFLGLFGIASRRARS